MCPCEKHFLSSAGNDNSDVLKNCVAFNTSDMFFSALRLNKDNICQLFFYSGRADPGNLACLALFSFFADAQGSHKVAG